MFTGLVETKGTVTQVSRRAGSTRLSVRSALPAEGTRPGASVCVDGVCLTVVSRAKGRFSCDVVAETLSRTTLGALRPGERVNLERALALGQPLGGHLVQGHVDATGVVVRVERKGDDCRLRVRLPSGLERYVSEKGSIALQGVSLTVAKISGRQLEVALIPETLRRTTLGAIRIGDSVNVEVDLLARYLERLLGSGAPARGRPRRGTGRTRR